MLNTAMLLAAALFQSELIFPPERIHNHASSIVELPNGDLFACWYHGSGERTADDVKVEAARLARGAKTWSARYTLADTPDFPDTNPIMFVDSKDRLWLLWSAIVANRWETALLKQRISAAGWKSDPVRFDMGDVVLFKPVNFEEKLGRPVEKYAARMGWMPRVHPLELPSGRILVPLYSDGFSFSLIAITDDGGINWTTSEPLVSRGGVQPALVRKKNGAIVAYMRDNGPPPKRVMTSESTDNGQTWSAVVDTEIPNPGSSVDVVGLKSGAWLMILNDTEKGRNSLAAWLSDDEGKTWKWKRHLELDKAEEKPGSFSYPSVIQAKDGSIHATYSFSAGKDQAIKHVRFEEAWVKGL